MGIIKFINDQRFNVFFSLMLGIGVVALFRPICSGSECNVSKAPTENDFDKYVYRMGGSKCYEFKTEIVECPSSGTIEAFRECRDNEYSHDTFSRRNTPIKRCD